MAHRTLIIALIFAAAGVVTMATQPSHGSTSSSDDAAATLQRSPRKHTSVASALELSGQPLLPSTPNITSTTSTSASATAAGEYGALCLITVRVTEPNATLRMGTRARCRAMPSLLATVERIHRTQRTAMVAIEVPCRTVQSCATAAKVAEHLVSHCSTELQLTPQSSVTAVKCRPAADEWRERRSSLQPPVSDARNRRQSSTGSSSTWTSNGAINRGLMYHNMDLIEARMDALAAFYPALVRRLVVGSSINQVNSITGLRISTTPAVNDAAKPEILLVGTHHAREWIAAEVPIGIAEALCALYYRNRRVRRMMRRVEFIIVPVLNPDGYRYSTLSNDNIHRYWRKNRRPVDGVDLNRNYPVYYGRDDGSSSNPYDDTYRGTAASSEPEVQALEALAANTSVVSRLAFFASYHNYGQDVLWPYGEAASDFSPIEALMSRLFSHMTGVVMAGCEGSVAYTAYKASGLYPVSGDAVDYMHKMFNNVPALTIELRPTDQFDLPVDQINATVLENVAPLLFYAEYALASMDALSAAGASADTVFAWWNDASNAAYQDNRVAAADTNSETSWDWFGVCESAASGAATANSVRVSNFFDTLSPFWATLNPTTTTLVNPATGASVVCRSASDVPSVLSGEGDTKPLRLHIDVSRASVSDTSKLSSLFAAAPTCDAVSTAALGSQLATMLSYAYVSASPSVSVNSVSNRTLMATGRWRCVVEFRFSTTNLAADAVDDVFAAAVAKVLAGTFGASDSALVGLMDASFDTSVVAAIAVTPPSNGVPVSPSPSSTAALTYTAAPLPVYTYLTDSSSATLGAWAAAVISSVCALFTM